MDVSDQNDHVINLIDVSIIVPVFNGGEKIRKCIEALKDQKTDKRYEVIVVDDGSTDNSLAGLESERVQVLRQANQGPAAARNLGVSKARGKIVLFTDADCEPLEDWLEQMVRPFNDSAQYSEGIGGVKGAYLTRQKTIVARFVQLEYESKYERMKNDKFIDFLDTYAAGFLREEFVRVGGYDTRFPTASVEDQEFSFRMWEAGCRMVFNPLAKVYHSHSDSLGNYMKKKFRIGYWKTLVLKRHPGKIVRDSHTPQTMKLEMAFAVLFLVCLGLCPFVNSAALFAVLPLVGFGITISPFVASLFKRDIVVALWSPFLLFARAVCLSLGLAMGVVQFSLVKDSGDQAFNASPLKSKSS